MERTKILNILTAGALVAVAILGAFTYRSVSAQDPTPTPEVGAGDSLRPERGMRGKAGGESVEDLAAALGIEVETLEAAQATALEQALGQAVSAGLITQEQADQMIQNGTSGRRWGGAKWLSENGIDYQALLAGALGISEDELNAARMEAFNTSIDEAVAAGSLTQEQADLLKGQKALSYDDAFQSSMKSAFESAVQQAVTDGVITQAQADQILANQSGRFSFPGFGRGGHGRGGRHGDQFRPVLPGFDPDPSPVTPSDDV